MIPWVFGFLAAAQLFAALGGCALFVFFGVLQLALWVPDRERYPKLVKTKVKEAYVLFGCALLCLVFGLYFYFVALVVVCIFLVMVFIESVKILLDE